MIKGYGEPTVSVNGWNAKSLIGKKLLGVTSDSSDCVVFYFESDDRVMVAIETKVPMAAELVAAVWHQPIYDDPGTAAPVPPADEDKKP